MNGYRKHCGEKNFCNQSKNYVWHMFTCYSTIYVFAQRVLSLAVQGCPFIGSVHIEPRLHM